VNINITIRESHLETLVRTSGKTKPYILQSLLDVINETVKYYSTSIKKNSIVYARSIDHRPYSRVLVHKPSKIKLRYSMFWAEHEKQNLQVMVKIPQSRYPKKPYTDKEIKDMFFTDQINQMLMNENK
jgi:hypothetical protein